MVSVENLEDCLYHTRRNLKCFPEEASTVIQESYRNSHSVCKNCLVIPSYSTIHNRILKLWHLRIQDLYILLGFPIHSKVILYVNNENKISLGHIKDFKIDIDLLHCSQMNIKFLEYSQHLNPSMLMVSISSDIKSPMNKKNSPVYQLPYGNQKFKSQINK